MYAFRKHAALNKKKLNAESFSFVMPKLNVNSVNEDPTASLLEQDKLPISKNQFANESILNQLEQKVGVQREQPQINVQEWGIQLSNHLKLIDDKSSNWVRNKYTKNAIEIINKQKFSTIENEKSQLSNQWILRFFSKLSVIEPTSNWLNLWSIFMSICLLIYFYFLMINLYFSKNEGDQEWYWDQWKQGYTGWLNMIYTLCMTLDILIEMHVSYFERGEYVKNKKQVYINYLKTGFFFDFIPLFVLYLCLISEQVNESTIIRYFFFFKFYKLSIYDQRFQERVQLHRKSKTIYLIFKIIVEILIIVQLNAALFYRAGIYMYDMKQEDEENFNWGTWLENDMFNGDIYSKSLQSQYFLSLYWSVATLTTVSYGDITPVNPLEILISTMAMLIAIFLFALNVQTIQEVYLEYKASKKKFQKHLIAINRFMRDKQISVSLQAKIRKYLDHIWDKQRAREQKLEQVVIDSLAPSLRQELMFESYGMDLIKIPWMSDNFTFEFIKELSEELREVYFAADETIFLDKETVHDDYSFYIVKEGQVDLFINSSNVAQPLVAHLKSGAVFGQYSFITGDGRQCSAKTRTQTTLYQVNRTTFINTLLKFEADYERYCQLKDLVMLGKRYDLLQLSCFTCNLSDHMSNCCPLTHFTFESQKNIMGSQIVKNEYKQQDRKKAKRRKAKQKNIIVNADEFEIDEAQLSELKQQYVEKPNDSYDIDKVHSFKYYFPCQNIDSFYYNQMRNISLNHKKYFTPPLRHQIVPK
ncbi:unnamed protein product [Paramecium primaurelia]|uniref:Cyclic nucleotide-binding domain-containing protein n=1 Tax=Paramecium primaurelia TaxID=5886 RepID=A0A8S1LU99_PARPR|nr:unnamed protein product [Paramecium primaurelia]